ncbi:unnamed protein product [Arctogadus glacialis]
MHSGMCFFGAFLPAIHLANSSQVMPTRLAAFAVSGVRLSAGILWCLAVLPPPTPFSSLHQLLGPRTAP